MQSDTSVGVIAPGHGGSGGGGAKRYVRGHLLASEPEQHPQHVTVPRDAMPARLASFRLLPMASQHWMRV